MESLDLLLLSSEALALLVLASRFVKGRDRQVLLLLPLFFMLLQLQLDGGKWQLAPAYFLAVLLPAVGLWRFRFSRWLRISGMWMAGVLVLIAGLFSWAFPIYELPAPAGPYAVGTTYLHLTDSSRKEMISADPHDYRELMVRVWYPSEAQTTGKPYPYLPPEYAAHFAKRNGFPGFIVSHLQQVISHSYPDLPMVRKEAPYPVIIFNHGYMWHSSMYTGIMEQLASHGYVVLGIDFTYETLVSIFPEEEKRWLNQVFVDTIWQGLSHDYYLALLDSFQQAQDLEQKTALMHKAMDYSAFSQRVDAWAEDVQFVVDEVAALNSRPASAWYNRLDSGRIGVMGHSMGGAAAGVACSRDPRIKAGINLDGTQWGSLLGARLEQPFMFMQPLRDDSHFDPGRFIYERTAVNNFYELTIEGTTHVNFGDLSFWSKLPALTQTGPLDGYRAIEIVNHYSTAFFDRYLKQQPEPLLEESQSPYPEVQLRKLKAKDASLARAQEP